MGADDAAGMLYRTPILFRTSGDFAHIGNEAVGVRAIGAIELFERVKISEMVTIKHEVVAAIYLGDPIRRKADGLIDGNEQVEQQQRRISE